jgi:hypothetical protein
MPRRSRGLLIQFYRRKPVPRNIGEFLFANSRDRTDSWTTYFHFTRKFREGGIAVDHDDY